MQRIEVTVGQSAGDSDTSLRDDERLARMQGLPGQDYGPGITQRLWQRSHDLIESHD